MNYDEIQAVNKSTLWEMRKSPLHFWHLMHDTPKEDTAAMKFGRATHKRLLQPSTFANEYVVAPECDRRTKEGKQIWADLAATGKEIISEQDFNKLLAMEREFKDARYYFLWDEEYHTEKVLTWTDNETGVECKGRLDVIMPDTIIDYKTTTNAGTDAFMREALRYGYDLQAAMYMEAARANGYDPRAFVFIAQEKDPPYLINILYASDAFLDRGAWIMRDLLKKYKECRDTDKWPGYGINQLILPEWEVNGDE